MMNLIKAVLIVASIYWMLTVDMTIPIGMVLPIVVAIVALILHKA
jgi:hypothetical protein